MNIWSCCITLVVILTCSHTRVAAKGNQQTKTNYIIHMDKVNMPTSFNDHMEWYGSSLKSVSDLADMIYTYNNVFHGFSTSLTSKEAKLLEKQPGVLSILPDTKYELHTTRTPEFLGLGRSETFLPQSRSQSEVIVGVIDTGVWPELKSFNDAGLGPVPSTWKGDCEVGKTFNSSSCNRKLIGARFFSKGYEATFGPIDETLESKSPRDDDGHGTHTSTTAAGSAVAGASLLGYAKGTARGMAAQARIATYKVCWLGGCFGSDILAAMDKAVADGVNILSMSIGGGVSELYKDTVAIGAFSAMAHGILVACSAGNSGPISMSVGNVAPWITTVGAGTLDRDFPAYVALGNGKKLNGVSLYSGKPLSGVFSLVSAGNASSVSDGNLCMTGSLIPAKVAGKIVVCDRGSNSRVSKGVAVKEAGGLGMILTNTDTFGEELVADAHLLPASAVGKRAGDVIKAYISSDRNPTATIIPGGTKLGVQPSPVVAAFSSRGPNPLNPEILKPDLIAPGLNILAGWSGAVGPTGIKTDTRRVSFNIISGTSMSCPHAAGLAALVKAAHPDWSPTAIRSALMTTAYSTYKTGQTIQDVATGIQSSPFDYGAGHVDPIAALDPGLLYDATVEDYLAFLCALNYTKSEIKRIANRDFTCGLRKTYNARDLNYPSFAVPFETALVGNNVGSHTASTVKYIRTVTNVGPPGAYRVSVISGAPSVKILVEPEQLTFTKANEKMSYTVTFTASSMPSGTSSFARLEWSDGKHKVGSPVAFTWM